MNKEIAWNNFEKTGSVFDYLTYRRIKNSSDSDFQGERLDADKYGRSCDKGNECF